VQKSGFKTALLLSLTLQVGQSVGRDFALEIGQITESIEELIGSERLVNTTSAVVDGVISSRAIESLPLNGRNFLELALLIPGNRPAPNFDPTKSNSVIISSAGQLGRGGNVTIDGVDNNDDAVGGPLMNLTQEAVLAGLPLPEAYFGMFRLYTVLVWPTLAAMIVVFALMIWQPRMS